MARNWSPEKHPLWGVLGPRPQLLLALVVLRSFFFVFSSFPQIIFSASSSCPEIIRLSINLSKATSPLSHFKAKANKTRLRRKHLYFVLKRTECSLVLPLVGDHRLSEQIQQIGQSVFQLLCLSLFLCFFYISVFAFETRRPVWVCVDWKARWAGAQTPRTPTDFICWRSS